MEETLWQKSITFYVRGQKVKVSEDIYKVYWQEKEHEKYLEQVAVRNAISRLNAEEKDIIERLYFNDETVRSVAKLKSITHPALIKRRNKVLEKLKKFIEEL